VVNGATLRALLDSGSTHNFVDTDVAARVEITLCGCAGLRVAVATGDRVSSPGCYHNLHLTVGGEPFDIDLYGIALGTYDMALGVQWLESLGPILWDFDRRTIAFVRNGHRVLWIAVAHPTAPPSLCTVSGDIMGDLLAHFAPLFVEPSVLPPPCQRLHQIRLAPGMTPVVVQPYQYAHLQKEELEWQRAEMLAHDVIRPSSSSLSAPVLVKKHDRSWCFYVDYCALNEKTVKDKFPIPVVEELLDELYGAAFFTKLNLHYGYHQVRMHPDDIEKMTFRTHQGLFVMGISLCGGGFFLSILDCF
jgi:hypothetical protein